MIAIGKDFKKALEFFKEKEEVQTGRAIIGVQSDGYRTCSIGWPAESRT